jgi:hypothetical protein
MSENTMVRSNRYYSTRHSDGKLQYRWVGIGLVSGATHGTDPRFILRDIDECLQRYGERGKPLSFLTIEVSAIGLSDLKGQKYYFG